MGQTPLKMDSDENGQDGGDSWTKICSRSEDPSGPAEIHQTADPAAELRVQIICVIFLGLKEDVDMLPWKQLHNVMHSLVIIVIVLDETVLMLIQQRTCSSCL